MGKYKSTILTLCLLAGVAFAVKQVAYDKVNSPKPQWFPTGLYVGTNTANPVRTTNNRVDGIYCDILDYDFPNIAPNYMLRSTAKTFTKTGVKLGDPCFVGVLKAAPDDAGSAWEDLLSYDCVVRSDNVVQIIATNAGGDGGSMNAPDAGYQVCVISTGKQAASVNNGN